MEFVFWTFVAVIVYTLFLYPILLYLSYTGIQILRDLAYLAGRRDRRRKPLDDESLAPVSVIVAAYNAGDYLEKTIAHLRSLDFPREKIELIFVADGSTDRTNQILASAQGEGIRVNICTVRRGKAEALNVGVGLASHNILVFCDASSLFASDAVRKLVRHFSDPSVGAVCGALTFMNTQESTQTEGVYWKYESMLRLMEARLGVTLTASGAIYAVRRGCYPRLTSDTILDDLVVPMNVRCLGYQVVYDPEATAVEVAAATVGEELTRRARLAMGSFRALKRFMFIPLRPAVTLAFFSHKLLRWLAPFFLIGLFVSNLFLLESRFYFAVLLVQLLFYLWAGMGFLFRERVKSVPYALVGYFLLAMQVAFLVGFFRFLRRRGAASP